MYPQTSINYVRHFGFPFEFNTPTLVHTAGAAVAHLSIAPGPIL